MRTIHVALIVLLSSMTALLPSAFAQDAYPSKPLQMIVSFPPGNASDTYARFFADRLSQELKQPVIVTNRPGANGFIAAVAAKQAPADGYTLFVGSVSPMAMNPALFKSLPYDPQRDFRWVSGIYQGTAVLVVPADSPYTTLESLISDARETPSKLNYGSYAAAYRLATEWLNQLANMETTHVPYKGASQVVMDLAASRLDFAMIDITTAIPQIEAGALRPLGVSTVERHPLLPNVPTIREAGFPEYAQAAWVALAVHAETSDDKVDLLANAMLSIMDTSEAKRFLAEQGGAPLRKGPKEMQAFNIQETEKYGKIVEQAGIERE